ncbi:MAG: M48 family metalloprotease [Ruminococcus sp.]|nr:M48 family metalloprotease [Ruminococcus sp.]
MERGIPIMYVFEFLKRMFRKSNTTVVIYLIINYILISAIIGLLFSGGGGIGILLGFVVGLVAYIISLALALSPVGEWLLRLQCQCHPIEKLSPELQNDILPIFQEVYQQARREDSSIAPDIKLYYTENEDENAFALGRKTIAVTTGGLQNPMFREQLKGILGHEFGHLAHKDTDLLLLITVGNMIITIGITILKIIILAATFLFNAAATIVGWLSHGDRDHGICVFFLKLGTSIASFLSLVFINLFMRLWTKIGQLLVMKGSRENEYEADAFACLLGYGRELYSFFQSMGGEEEVSKLGILVSTHPPTALRMERVQNLINEQERIARERTASINRRADDIMEKRGARIPDYATSSSGSRVSTTTRSVPPIRVETPQPQPERPYAAVHYCKQCGAILSEGARFCKACGSSVHSEISRSYERAPIPAAAVVPQARKTCPRCHASIKASAAFCVKCGNRFS